MTRFSENFWNAEFCNFLGFEVLCRRMSNGKQLLKDFVEFLRQRAQIQEAYGKALVKLARSSGGREETGTLRLAWDSFQSQTEGIGMAHITTAETLYEEAARMLEFLDLQRDQRKQAENNVRRSQLNLKMLYKRMLESKKCAENRCREVGNIMQLSEIEMSKSNCSQKDMEKLQQKQIKAFQAAEQAERIYKSALEALEAARIQWEVQTESAYELFQLLEEERINCVRNSMWVVTNLGSAACVAEDMAYERARKKLEKCDIDADLQLFIQQKKTGSQKPTPIVYVESGPLPENCHQPPIKYLSRPSRLDPLSSGRVLNSPNLRTNVTESTASNDLCANVNETPLQNSSPLRPAFKVLYEFKGRNNEEISLHTNDIVRLVCKESDEWWEVETREGDQGFFPASYLKPI